MNAEIEEIREGYWGRPGSEQEIRIRNLFAHIDQQQATIENLKAACIHAEAKGMMLQHNEWSRDIKDLDDFVEDAKGQLAREMPGIFGDKKCLR